MSPACGVCGGSVHETHRGVLLGRHEARYLMCDVCEYWFVAEPTWLDEAYSRAIAATDTGLVARNLTARDALTSILIKLFDPKGSFVDYAGGYGLLVRLMRDRGFDFYWQDAYADNLFADGFAWTDDGQAPRAEAVTCVEVFEHAPAPADFVDEVLTRTGTDSIIFSQHLHEGPDPEWWYLAPETGQHISFYSEKTLHALASRFDLTYHRAPWLHLFTRRDLPQGAFERAARPPRRWAPLFGPASPLPSRSAEDHERALRAAR